MAKSPDAFRTISEVAEWLDTPAHVLRFWESKFTQIKPIKRAGGRRYYRPEDMELLGGIKTLLHEQGLTIKGAQRLLREKGVRYVASLGPAAEDAGSSDAKPQDQAEMVASQVAKVIAPPLEMPAVEQAKPAEPPHVHPVHPDHIDHLRYSERPAPFHHLEPNPVVVPLPRAEPTAPDFSAALRDIPAATVDHDRLPQPRLLASLRKADPRSVQRNAARIRPLLRQLTEMRDRIARD